MGARSCERDPQIAQAVRRGCRQTKVSTNYESQRSFLSGAVLETFNKLVA
jgi:hypothetical protein